ncbi:hypothetical protein ACIODS_12315 [Micromonospora chalcea]|uniref:hypothetical protein n=1 Tax=Micromonospora chalcea TaxID=1874 RepID=UPI0038058E55
MIIDVAENGEWAQIDSPSILATEDSPHELAAHTAMSYGLNDSPGQWQVRVYDGYNRFDNLLAALRDTDEPAAGEGGG